MPAVPSSKPQGPIPPYRSLMYRRRMELRDWRWKMDRRDLLKATLIGGGAFTFAPSVGQAPVEAARKTGGKFYRGLLIIEASEKFPWQSWRIQLVTVAARVEGFARGTDEDTPDLCISGKVKRGRLRAGVWDRRDLTKTVGTLSGKLQDSTIQGSV